MKFILRIIGVIISIGLALLLLMILINLTFFKETYKTSYMDGEGIPVVKYMYHMFNSTDNLGKFITFAGVDDVNTVKNNYTSKLESCYGKYYYDSANNITLIDYKVVDQGLYRDVAINYQYGNYCSGDYQLSDDWITIYTDQSKLEESNITITSAVLLMLELQNSERVSNPIIDDTYKSEVSINLFCSQLLANKYTIEIKDFKEDEILVVKTLVNEKQFAVYKVENAKEFLRGLL